MERTQISLYWKCQLIGWTTASLYWAFVAITSGQFLWGLGFAQLVTDVILYAGITHLYKLFAESNKWQLLPLNSLMVRMFIAVPVMGIIYTCCTIPKVYFLRTMFVNSGRLDLDQFALTNISGIFMAGIRLMSIWLLAYHLYHYARREVALANENAVLQLGFKQAQLDNLSSQLNPHFLFNALNTVKSLIYTRPDGAARGIDLLSEILRNSLYRGNAMMVRLDEEIALVKDYLELESMRMEERLRFEFQINVPDLSVSIPRLSLQLLVENAVKHGIAKRLTGGKVTIATYQQKDFLCVEVTNPGKLELDNENAGIGLENLKNRLDIGYKGAAKFNISQHEENVLATLIIPMA
ncbi:sensor histidine kinase [Pedobacter soli]|uniref:Histidine kinase n=1 Tax=Pedobacter soli TaxID=390242 RepID=A0A1G7AF81_9SPHI|nr:histidine kinase [Pedobacter soli]SDE13584.1 Histidine kinase [Pedobacter soli]